MVYLQFLFNSYNFCFHAIRYDILTLNIFMYIIRISDGGGKIDIFTMKVDIQKKLFAQLWHRWKRERGIKFVGK